MVICFVNDECSPKQVHLHDLAQRLTTRDRDSAHLGNAVKPFVLKDERARLLSAGLGRSLILQAHVDVVPTGSADMWTHKPFDPVIEGDWLYGRGGADMKLAMPQPVLPRCAATYRDAARRDGLCAIRVEEESTATAR
jgi:hypothetical protein